MDAAWLQALTYLKSYIQAERFLTVFLQFIVGEQRQIYASKSQKENKGGVYYFLFCHSFIVLSLISWVRIRSPDYRATVETIFVPYLTPYLYPICTLFVPYLTALHSAILSLISHFVTHFFCPYQKSGLDPFSLTLLFQREIIQYLMVLHGFIIEYRVQSTDYFNTLFLSSPSKRSQYIHFKIRFQSV